MAKKASELHKKWLDDPDYRAEYEALAEEFELAGALIAARKTAGLTQTELALRMETTQSVISRLEGGADNTTIETLQRVAVATGTKLNISFEELGH
jgi:ribosome-binding protein aMBF1 (putative translation factor)